MGKANTVKQTMKNARIRLKDIEKFLVLEKWKEETKKAKIKRNKYIYIYTFLELREILYLSSIFIQTQLSELIRTPQEPT